MWFNDGTKGIINIDIETQFNNSDTLVAKRLALSLGGIKLVGHIASIGKGDASSLLTIGLGHNTATRSDGTQGAKFISVGINNSGDTDALGFQYDAGVQDMSDGSYEKVQANSGLSRKILEFAYVFSKIKQGVQIKNPIPGKGPEIFPFPKPIPGRVPSPA